MSIHITSLYLHNLNLNPLRLAVFSNFRRKSSKNRQRSVLYHVDNLIESLRFSQCLGQEEGAECKNDHEIELQLSISRYGTRIFYDRRCHCRDKKVSYEISNTHMQYVAFFNVAVCHSTYV